MDCRGQGSVLASSASASSIAPGSSASNQIESQRLVVWSPAELGVDLSKLSDELKVKVLCEYYSACNKLAGSQASSLLSSQSGDSGSSARTSSTASRRRRRRRKLGSSKVSKLRVDIDQSGQCYLRFVSVGYRDQVLAECGVFPTFQVLFTVPWRYIDKTRLFELHADENDRSECHIGLSGLPLVPLMGHLARAGGVGYAEGSLGAVISKCADMPDSYEGKLTLTSSVGGEQSYVPFVEATRHRSVECSPDRDGFCYLEMIRSERWADVSAKLGKFPSFCSILDIDYADTVKLDGLSEICLVEFAKGIYHVADSGMPIVPVLANLSGMKANLKSGSLASRARSWPRFVQDSVLHRVDQFDRLGASGSTVVYTDELPSWPSLLPKGRIIFQQRESSVAVQTVGSVKPWFRVKLTTAEKIRICQMRESEPAMRHSDIAKKFNVDRSTVSKVLREGDMATDVKRVRTYTDACSLPFYTAIVSPSHLNSALPLMAISTSLTFGFSSMSWFLSRDVPFDVNLKFQLDEQSAVWIKERCEICLYWIVKDDVGDMHPVDMRDLPRRSVSRVSQEQEEVVLADHSYRQSFKLNSQGDTDISISGLTLRDYGSISELIFERRIAHLMVEICYFDREDERWYMFMTMSSFPFQIQSKSKQSNTFNFDDYRGYISAEADKYGYADDCED